MRPRGLRLPLSQSLRSPATVQPTVGLSQGPPLPVQPLISLTWMTAAPPPHWSPCFSFWCLLILLSTQQPGHLVKQKSDHGNPCSEPSGGFALCSRGPQDLPMACDHLQNGLCYLSDLITSQSPLIYSTPVKQPPCYPSRSLEHLAPGPLHLQMLLPESSPFLPIS